MEIVTLVTPDTEQLCVHCLVDQHEGKSIPTPIYGERGSTLIGYCLEHGPFEIEPFADLPRHEEIIYNNFTNLLMGAGFGQTVMIRKHEPNGNKNFYLAYRNTDGSIRIVAQMLDPMDNEHLNPA